MPPIVDPASTSIIQRFLRDSDFTQQGLQRIFGSGLRGEPSAQLNPSDAPMLVRRSRNAGALERLLTHLEPIVDERLAALPGPG